MRNLLKALAVVAAVVPVLASAQITGSKHDLSSLNTLVPTRATAAPGADQTCIFCHTPHRATQQSLIWNRAASTNSTYTFGAGASTTAGTTLPTASIGASSRVCLSCHDGSIALGQVANSNGVAATFAMTQQITATGSLMGQGGNLAGNHPISVPYPGATKGAASYNTIVSQAIAQTATFGDYFPAQVAAACQSATGACTTAATTGVFVQLYGNAINSLGMECGSCHEVHNKYALTYFLRVTGAQSALCRACHNK